MRFHSPSIIHTDESAKGYNKTGSEPLPLREVVYQLRFALDSYPGSGPSMFEEGPMSRLYHVHEFAELARVTVKALHHYDRLGLSEPRRTDAGYRVYTLSDLERLEQIVALKFIGLPLKESRLTRSL